MLWAQGESAVKFFTVENILKGTAQMKPLDESTSEVIRRPPVGLSMCCGTVESGMDALSLVPENLHDMTEPGAGCSQRTVASDAQACQKAYGKTGLPAARRLWRTGDGPSLAAAIRHLNMAVDRPRSLADTKNALRTLRSVFGDRDTAPARMREYARELDFASRLVGEATGKMELTVLFCNTKKWATRIPEPKKQHEEVRKWIESPKDEGLLVRGLARAIHSRTEDAKKTPALQKIDGSDSDFSAQGDDGTDKSEHGQDRKDESNSDSSADQGTGRDSRRRRVSRAEQRGESSESDSGQRKQRATRSAAPAAPCARLCACGYERAACGACGRGYAQQDANRKLSYQEWHNLGIRDGTDVEQEVGKLDEATTRRLANGIVGADDLQHPQTAIAAAKAKILRCQPAEAKAADVRASWGLRPSDGNSRPPGGNSFYGRLTGRIV